MTIKIRREKRGSHVHLTVFVGEADKTKANCGTLLMLPEEAEMFLICLINGSEATHGITLEAEE